MTPLRCRAFRFSFFLTFAMVVLAMVPLPGKALRSALRSVRSPELNRADRDTHAVGYYVGLIDGGADGGRDELTLRLLGKTSDWKSFHEIGAAHYLKDDFLQFELKPNLDKPVFGKRFTTNEHGLRDLPYSFAKPEKTFRIAVLGSSMDMGWGVGTDETYENHLELWLNAHAQKYGIHRKYEVLNFAMAAYSPLHRLETFRRKALKYKPDLVLYSATMLDTRLLEIHVRNLLQERLDLRYDFLRRTVSDAKIGPKDLRLDAFGDLRDKEALKQRLRPHLWDVVDATVGELATECEAEGIPLAMVLIPRVGQADAPDARGPSVLRFEEIARNHGVSLIDLSATFDDQDPGQIEIAAWDDHPNDLGHKLLFEAIARDLIKDESLYRIIFGASPPHP